MTMLTDPNDNPTLPALLSNARLFIPCLPALSLWQMQVLVIRSTLATAE